MPPRLPKPDRSHKASAQIRRIVLDTGRSGPPGYAAPVPDQAARAAFADDVRRLADRLRGLSEARLDGPLPPHASRAAAARALAQLLADAAQDLEEPGAPRRTVPDLGVFAVGDQVAVTGADLLAAAGSTDRDVPAEVVESVADLRRRL